MNYEDEAIDDGHEFWDWLRAQKEPLQDDKLAQAVYAALCNRIPQKLDAPPYNWRASASWRTAGGFVAEIRDQGETYMDFYCSGINGWGKWTANDTVPEGFLSPEAEAFLATGGWTTREWTQEELDSGWDDCWDPKITWKAEK